MISKILMATPTSLGSFEDSVRSCPYTLNVHLSGEHLVNVSPCDGCRGGAVTGFSKVTSLFQFNKLLGFHICLPVYFMITLKGTDLFGPSLIHCILNF